MPTERVPNADRFSGFADLYDANRPSPPPELGALLESYAHVRNAAVVDLGSGTGLSSRWAAGWAASVVGVEPSDDMRTRAEACGGQRIRYVSGVSNNTGLDANSADVVIAVQALHLLEPVSTLAEVVRLLRPGGVFAVIDADWPPVAGIVAAELAWARVHARIRVLEARLAGDQTGPALRAPIDFCDPALVDEDLVDPHKNRAMPGGARSWSKSDHLRNIRMSGHFAHVRELVLSSSVADDGNAGAERFIALLRSQGSYHALVRRGLSDGDIGVDVFEHNVRAGYVATAAAGVPPSPLRFSWRVRLGVLG